MSGVKGVSRLELVNHEKRDYVTVELTAIGVAVVSHNKGFCVDITDLLKREREKAVLNFIETADLKSEQNHE